MLLWINDDREVFLVKRRTEMKDQSCDFCKVVPKIIYDARLKSGSWAYMCPSCWKRYRASEKLGTGYGQKFSNVTGNKLEG